MFGERLKELRQQKNMTQREVVEKSEDEILLEIKYAQERVVMLNQEIRAGLQAIKDKLEAKENLKELMAQSQREY